MSHLQIGLRYLLGAFFIFAGSLHFARSEPFVAIVPPYLPYPLALVLISGFFEILGGVGVLIPRTRRLAGYGLIALLAAVFPANVHMAVHAIQLPGLHVPDSLLWYRLPLQLVLIAWVWWCACTHDGTSPGKKNEMTN
ncbi:MAG: DoxX family protein [Planctomycetota bacterium]|nr:DoxX family protein [Planctomycetota bacterium]MDA1140714.1 DoxX family protein [Planctomycetota bacterium]